MSFFVCYHLHLCHLRPAKCIIPHAEPPRCVARVVGRLLMMSEKKTPLILTELFLVAGGEEDVCGFPGLPVGGQLLLGPGPNNHPLPHRHNSKYTKDTSFLRGSVQN